MPKPVRAIRLSPLGPRVVSGESATRFGTSRDGECKPRPTLLWIDDFAPALSLYKVMLEGLGFRVLTASSGKAGVRIASTNRLDLVVTDYEMPEMNGEEVAVAIKALNPRIPVLLFSGSALVPRRMKHLVDACCDKAAPRNQLLGAIHRLLQRKAVLETAPVTRASDHGQRTVADPETFV